MLATAGGSWAFQWSNDTLQTLPHHHAGSYRFALGFPGRIHDSFRWPSNTTARSWAIDPDKRAVGCRTGIKLTPDGRIFPSNLLAVGISLRGISRSAVGCIQGIGQAGAGGRLIYENIH